MQPIVLSSFLESPGHEEKALPIERLAFRLGRRAPQRVNWLTLVANLSETAMPRSDSMQI